MEQLGGVAGGIAGLRHSRIAGTGRYLPERVLTNRDLEKLVDTTDEWIRTRTGMERRHLAAAEQASSDLAIPAARAALESANCAPEEIDLVVVGTTTPDLVFPNVGCMVQDALGIPPCGAFSCEAACTGWLYALSLADGLIRLGRANKALVVGVEVLSRITDWSDRSTCVLFGDGAGAVVLEPAQEPGMMSFILGADGSYVDILRSRAGISRNPHELSDGGLAVRMKGSEVFKIAVRTMGKTVDRLLEQHGLTRDDIDWLIPHQANNPHHSGNRQAAEPARRKGGADLAGSRQYRGRVHPAGAGCGGEGWTNQAWTAHNDGVVWWRIDLGRRNDAVLDD